MEKYGILEKAIFGMAVLVVILLLFVVIYSVYLKLNK